MASSTTAAAALVGLPPASDDWEEEEEVMVLVDLPEFGGVDLFEGARSIEIRVRVSSWCGGCFLGLSLPGLGDGWIHGCVCVCVLNERRHLAS